MKNANGYVEDDVTGYRSINERNCRGGVTISVETDVMDLMGTAMFM